MALLQGGLTQWWHVLRDNVYQSKLIHATTLYCTHSEAQYSPHILLTRQATARAQSQTGEGPRHRPPQSNAATSAHTVAPTRQSVAESHQPPHPRPTRSHRRHVLSLLQPLIKPWGSLDRVALLPVLVWAPALYREPLASGGVYFY